MAIIDKLPGIKVTVCVNGEALPEYPDEDGANDTIFQQKRESFTIAPHMQSSNYVECVSDTEFEVKIEAGPPFNLESQYDQVVFWVEIDGQNIAGQYVPLANFQDQVFRSTIGEALTQINVNELSSRKLQFRGIAKVDEKDKDRIEADKNLALGLGEIVVHFHRVKTSTVLTQSRVSRPQADAAAEIAEKALKGKAISHGVGFGAEKIVRANTSAQYQKTYPDGYNKPLAIFRFKYRSRESLQAELVISRSPSPEPADDPLSRIDGNSSKVRQERIAALKKEIADIKNEGSGGRKRARSGEDAGSNKASKISREEEEYEIVDLTDA